jgi:RTX calcium-binding nonapeptide repeat (4 copies)
MGRIRMLLVGAGVLAGVSAAIASAGVFGDQNGRAFCDEESDPADRVFWGAAEVPGDRNDVLAGFSVQQDGVGVINEYDPAVGPPDSSLTSCVIKGAGWKLFRAKLGTKADSVRFGGHPGFGADFAAPPSRIVARIDLGPGNDQASGHKGPDKVKGGPGKDTIETGGGRDNVKVAGGGKDAVNCGPKADRAVADERDSVRGCERLKIR